jgi:hypothetical protein
MDSRSFGRYKKRTGRPNAKISLSVSVNSNWTHGKTFSRGPLYACDSFSPDLRRGLIPMGLDQPYEEASASHSGILPLSTLECRTRV